MLFTIVTILICVTKLVYSRLKTFHVTAGLHVRAVRRVIGLPLKFTRDFNDKGLHGVIGRSDTTARACLTRRLPSETGTVTAPYNLLILLFIFS